MANSTFSVLRRLAIIVAIGITFLFGLVSTVYLSLRSSEVRVPEVVGRDRFEAERILGDAGLNFRVRATRPSKQSKPDTVLFQLPRAGEVVKAGQTVAMDVSRAAREGEAAESEDTDKKVAEEKAAERENANTETNENRPKRSRNANKNANDNANENANSRANANANTKANANQTGKNANTDRKANANSSVNETPAPTPRANPADDRRPPAPAKPSPAARKNSTEP